MHYCIGDLHGQLTALVGLLEKIQYNPEQDFLYFLGDYTDWGPDSMGVLRLVRKLQKENAHVIALLGNHDLMMRTCINDPDILEETRNHYGSWARNRGDVTLEKFQALSADEQEEIRQWLETLPVDVTVTVNDQTYLICHGIPRCVIRHRYAVIEEINPDEETIIHDAVWYRIRPTEKPIQTVPELSGAKIVRGHSITPSRRVEFWDNGVINIDSGAKCFGVTLEEEDGDVEEWTRDQDARLSALCLEDETVISVNREGL